MELDLSNKTLGEQKFNKLIFSIELTDLNKVSDRIKRITGQTSKIVRFPGGSSNTISRNYNKGIMTELSNLVLNQGYRYFDWNVDSGDAGNADTTLCLLFT